MLKPKAVSFQRAAAAIVALRPGDPHGLRPVPAQPAPCDCTRAARRADRQGLPEAADGAWVVWLTGLSGAGKSTIAAGLRERLAATGTVAVILDGDEIRTGLSQGLGFSAPERRENIRRLAHVARLLSGQGIVAIVAVISPLREQRALARDIVGASYHEVFVDAPLAMCERRDVKGLYARARRGELTSFTGVSDAYEAPAAPDLRVDTAGCDVHGAVSQVMASLGRRARAPAAVQPGPAPGVPSLPGPGGRPPHPKAAPVGHGNHD